MLQTRKAATLIFLFLEICLVAFLFTNEDVSCAFTADRLIQKIKQALRLICSAVYVKA